MIAASIIMGRALAPVELAVAQWRSFVSARDSYGRMIDLISAQPTPKAKMDLPAPSGRVSVEDVFIRAPNADLVILNNISLNFEPGTVTGVVGPSGSGKSSLVRAIVGVWPTARMQYALMAQVLITGLQRKLVHTLGIYRRMLSFLAVPSLRIFVDFKKLTPVRLFWQQNALGCMILF